MAAGKVKEKKKGKKANGKGQARKRLYTPQEIMAYYRQKGELPPGMQKRVEK